MRRMLVVLNISLMSYSLLLSRSSSLLNSLAYCAILVPLPDLLLLPELLNFHVGSNIKLLWATS
jgi:hypothetical protein